MAKLITMDFQTRIKSHFEENAKAHIDALEALGVSIERSIQTLNACLKANKKILACGNGGSASDAQHFVAELIGRFERERHALPAIALNTDTSIMTAVSNDYGYDDVFARQVRGLGVEGDVIIAISTSGNSKNVIEAIHAAHDAGMKVIALTGRDGGAMRGLLREDDIELCVPSNRTMRIQEVHILLLHILCDGIDAILFGDKL